MNIDKVKAEIERLKDFFKTEREKTTTTDKGMVDKLSFSSKIVVLEELLVFINSLSAEPSEELEDAANIYADTHPGVCHESDGGLFYDYDKPKRDFIAGAQWQKEQSTKLLKTIYSDCDNLKKDLDRVTTGNLPHRIGNIKFIITGIQVIIKQAMEDEQ